MKLILLGAPGAGKGTQAEVICEKLSIPAISTGNILREAMKNGTEMGMKAKSFIDSGALVPDDVIISIIKERLAEDDCKGGFILDGVPRTVAQAEALEQLGVEIDKVVDIEVPPVAPVTTPFTNPAPSPTCATGAAGRSSCARTTSPPPSWSG